MPPRYPLFLNINNRKVIVVGGGKVCHQKLRSLAGCGAAITIISPHLCASVTAMLTKGNISWLARPYQKGDLSGALLVFAATSDPDTNAQIGADGAAAGVLVNRCDDNQASDFHCGALFRRNNLTMAISADGVPLLSQIVKNKLENNAEITHIAALIDEIKLLRAELKKDQTLSISQRKERIRAAISAHQRLTDSD